MENKQDKGFTLVELLIVIVILGILATVTVFAVRGITDQGQTSACKADKTTMQTAVEAWYAQNGTKVDATEAGLVPDYMVSQSKGYDIVGGEVVLAPAIIPAVDEVLASDGPDDLPGTADDVAAAPAIPAGTNDCTA